jgi:formylglycine-generating enzyme required for sulfatase activity
MCPSSTVRIPAGTFMMGQADPLSLRAQPPHMVTLSAYCIDLTEVTVAAYRACTAVGCATPSDGPGSLCNWESTDREDHPLNCVNWNEARAYCRSVGGDLPTEAQWEYAARGTDGRTYPWGNTAPESQLCLGNFSSPTCAVRSYPSGNSPFGVFDMAGNVLEWTLDFYSIYTSAAVTDPTGPDSGPGRVDRGGGYIEVNFDVGRAAFRDYNDPSNRYPSMGFRCVRGAI